MEFKIPTLSEIKDIIEKEENIDEEIKSNLIRSIDTNFKNDFELKRFAIKKIIIHGNPNTEYNGLIINLTHMKPITIIKGPNGTGKTTSFDKIWHLFRNHKRQSSKIRKLLTNLELILKDQNENLEYYIKYHSQHGYNGNQFEIFKNILNPDLSVLKSVQLSDPEDFLKKNLVIDYKLNETMFISEILDNSFVQKYCVNETQMRQLFRLPIINFLFDEVKNYDIDFKKKVENLENQIKTAEINLENNKYTKERIEKEIANYQFIIDNEISFIEASKVYNKADEDLKKRGESIEKKIRGLKLKLKNKRRELDELNKFNIKNVIDKLDLFYQAEPRYCWKCDSNIIINKFKKRLEKSLCYVCGIGTIDYSSELKVIPEIEISEFDKNKKIIQQEISNFKTEIDKYYRRIGAYIKKPENIDDKVWKKCKYIDDINNEIEAANLLVDEDKIKIDALDENIIKNKTLLEKNKKILEKLGKKLKSLDIIKKKLKNIEEEQFQNYKKEIFNLTNQILIEFTDKTIGYLNFNENGELVLLSSFYTDETKKKALDKTRRLYDSKSYVSPGTLRKIDFAFALAFFFLNRKNHMRPLNLIIIDSMNFLDSADQEMIYRSFLKENPDYQILIFNNEIPTNLDETDYEITNITRNPLLRILEPLKSIKRQTSLDRFL